MLTTEAGKSEAYIRVGRAYLNHVGPIKKFSKKRVEFFSGAMDAPARSARENPALLP